MKWTKFNDDYKKGGSLYKLSGNNITSHSQYKAWEKIEIKDVCFKNIKCDRLEFENGLLNKGNAPKNIKALANKYHKWVCHNGLPDAYFDPKYFEKKYFESLEINDIDGNDVPAASYENITPHPYEIYIGGWIHFYDSEIQSGYSDHAVYFHWDYKCRCVSVYISQLSTDKRWNVNVNLSINPPGSGDPTKPTIPPPYC